MTLNEYQKAALKTADYPKSMWIEYPSLGLVGESGEVADKVKKLIRDDLWEPGMPIPDDRREAIALELGDVMWYAVVMLDRKGWLASDAMNAFDLSGDIEIDDRVPHIMAYMRKVAEMNNDLYILAVLLVKVASTYSLATIMADTMARKTPMIFVVGIVAKMAEQIGYTLNEICQMNIDKLESRAKRNTLHGSGDYR